MKLLNHVSLVTLISMGLWVAQIATAQETGQAQGKHWRHHGGFRMGVCVGQSLAQQSPPVILTPGQAPTAAQKSAFKAATTACRAQYKSSRNGT
jgi:hypothetical protein